MKPRSLFMRRTVNGMLRAISLISALAGIFVLAWILLTVISRGANALSVSFFTALPTPPGTGGGGIANAIMGSILITGIATSIGIPSGILGGIYLAEYGRGTTLAKILTFAVNVLIGVPSIIIGLFVYSFMVLPTGRFSGYAGATALAIIMIPVIVRTTVDMISMVPGTLRESALALGASHTQVILGVVFRASRRGLLTGMLLAIARISGETAPLLFTTLNSTYWPSSLSQPTANITVTIFNYAMSPYPDWQQIAWGATLLIMLFVLMLSILSRLFTRGIDE